MLASEVERRNACVHKGEKCSLKQNIVCVGFFITLAIYYHANNYKYNILTMNTLKSVKMLMATICLFFLCQVKAQNTSPEPLSGNELTKDFISANLIYPEEELANKNSGKVVIALHIDKDGKGSNHQVKSSFSEAASPIALDLVKKIIWKPATSIALPVESDFEYTIDFNAKNYNRYWKKHERIAIPLTLEADDSYEIFENKMLEEYAQPYFADGSNMGQYIYGNLRFPAEAQEREIQGTVRLSFIVETNGNVSNIIIVNSVGGGCDNEAVRLIQETHWIPGIKNGKYVRSRNMQDITFRIGQRNYQDGNSY